MDTYHSADVSPLGPDRRQPLCRRQTLCRPPRVPGASPPGYPGIPTGYRRAVPASSPGYRNSPLGIPRFRDPPPHVPWILKKPPLLAVLSEGIHVPPFCTYRNHGSMITIWSLDQRRSIPSLDGRAIAREHTHACDIARSVYWSKVAEKEVKRIDIPV
jgi:hypothetical protein